VRGVDVGRVGEGVAGVFGEREVFGPWRRRLDRSSYPARVDAESGA
jgi:hypothetical protein